MFLEVLRHVDYSLHWFSKSRTWSASARSVRARDATRVAMSHTSTQYFTLLKALAKTGI